MKKQFSITLLVLFISASLAFAQTRETRTVDTFTKISFGFAGKLYLKQGSPQKVEVEGKKEVLDKINVEVEGNRLVITSNEKWFNWVWGKDDHIVVYVTVENIEGINISGSGDVIAQTKLTSDELDVKVSGSGSLKGKVDVTNKVEANVSGSGRIELDGKCKRFESSVSGSGKIMLAGTIADKAEFKVSGSGRIEARGTADEVEVSVTGSGKVLAANLEANTCDVRISGSGNVEINVIKDLDTRISGSGSVLYKGQPHHLNTSSSGSGKVRKL